MQKNIINAENAGNGFLDKSGVKDKTFQAAPEPLKADETKTSLSFYEEQCRHDADDGETGIKNYAENNVAESGDFGQTKPNIRDEAETEADIAVSSEENNIISESNATDAEKEDKEFLSLIRGKYKEAYKRRTESIIRKRLRNSRSRVISGTEDDFLSGLQKERCTELSQPVNSEKKNAGTLKVEGIYGDKSSIKSEKNQSSNSSYNGDYNSDIGFNEKTEKQVADMRKTNAEAMIKANRSRPCENGISGSIGMVTGINVSTLNGSDILKLLKRVETGEKIRFK